MASVKVPTRLSGNDPRKAFLRRLRAEVRLELRFGSKETKAVAREVNRVIDRLDRDRLLRINVFKLRVARESVR